MRDDRVPQEVVLHGQGGRLEMRWADGKQASFTARTLREACKCATCENRRRAGQPPVAPVDTALTQLHPIGDMGLQLVFSDGHDRGIYPWPYLHQLSLETSA